MFKCGDKCTGRLAAEARLVREKVCFQNANKANDIRGMTNARRKMKDTTDYIISMEKWPASVNLAIGPALMVYRIKSPTKRTAVMKQIENAQTSGVNPMNGEKLGYKGITGVIIKYLIAKHDRAEFNREKRFVLTPKNVNIINYLMGTCQNQPDAMQFLKSLVAV